MWLNASNSDNIDDDWICEEMVEDSGILMQQVHMPVKVVKATLLEVLSMAVDYSHGVTVRFFCTNC